MNGASSGSPDPGSDESDSSVLLGPIGYDSRNSAPETRARYRYQDECIALAILGHVESPEFLGAAIEYSTDLILIPSTGKPELVSIKHREQNQAADTFWSWAALKRQSVLKDLYQAWRRADKQSTVAFWTNGGFSGPTYQLWRVCALGEPPSTELIRKLAHNIGASLSEAEEFLQVLSIPADALPRRKEITAVGVRKTGALQRRHGAHHITDAETTYALLIEAIANAGTDGPDDGQRSDAVAATLHLAVKSPEHLQAKRGFLARTDLLKLLLGQSSDARPANTPRTDPGWEKDPEFVGRRKYLEQLTDALRPGTQGSVAPVVIYGVPGCGKTSLALQFGASHTAALKPHFLNASSRAALIRDLEALADGDANGQWNDGVSIIRGPVTPTLPTGSDALLILDGVDDAEIIRGIVPRVTTCKILITSTVPFLDLGLTHIELVTWSRAESMEFISKALPDSSNADRERLAEALHDHPLALSQAVSYCRSTGRPVDRFLARLADEPLIALDQGQASGHPESIVKTITIRLGDLARRDPLSADILTLIAHFGDGPIDDQLFYGRWPLSYVRSPTPPSLRERMKRIIRGRFRAVNEPSYEVTAEGWRIFQSMKAQPVEGAIDHLVNASLLQRRPSGLIIHPLVAKIVRARVSNHTPWLELGFGLYTHLIDADENNDGLLDAHLIHVIRLTTQALDSDLDGPGVVLACMFLSRRLSSLGINTGAASATEFAEAGLYAAAVCVANGSSKALLAAHRAAAAQAYFWAGNVGRSVSLLSANLHLARQAGDFDLALRSILSMGVMIGESSDRQLAETALKALPPDDLPLRSVTRISLAHVKVLLFRLLNRMEDAYAASEEALSLIETTADVPVHVREDTYRDAAMLARDRGDSEMLYKYDNLVLSVRSEVAGTHTDFMLLGAYNGAADAAIEVGNLDEAAELIRKAEQLIPDDFDRRTSPYGDLLATRGRLKFVTGRYREAIEDLNDAIAILECYSYARSHLPSPLVHLGQSLAVTGHVAEGIAAVKRAYEIDSQLFGPTHPESLKDLSILRPMQAFYSWIGNDMED